MKNKRYLHCILTLLVGLFALPSISFAQGTVEVKGTNFSILPLQKGQVVFTNRTMVFEEEIPTQYTGWQFTQINANSTYLPGPLPELEVRAAEDGYLTVMVEDKEKPEVCSAWATAGGWEKLPEAEGSIKYAFANDKQTLYFYRRPIKAGEWVKVEQPATFSGALVIAPALKEYEEVSETRFKSIDVSITTTGNLEVDKLKSGIKAFSNRSYVFENVPEEVSGLAFTRFDGGGFPKLNLKAKAAGDLYIATQVGQTGYNAVEHGWTLVNDVKFNYNDGTHTAYEVYKRTMAADETISLESSEWTGILVIAENIEFEIKKFVTTPPGVVINNSPAATGKYIGSPSITILPDGTYLASHDFFGGIISYSYVYESKDKGQTWTKISEINPLTWSKLFTRGDEVYLLGVQPRCNMGYGNIVILKSLDGGKTWTNPSSALKGLLRQGYYHTAPTPVVFHNGRIWKGMENQGDAYWGWGPFGAFVMSASENADLLKASSWAYSNELQYTKGLVSANTWLEGNVVVARDGSIKDILRLDYPQDDRAGVISISADGRKATFNADTDISNVPGACKKFTIRYDSITDRYWTLSNYALDKWRPIKNVGDIRNCIVLAYSDDLVDWTIKDTLLYTEDVHQSGFQYVDWLFEGNDIIAVSRTAWEDETGKAPRTHDANFLTFHRFPNFRYERTATDQDIKVMRWAGNAKSAFAVTFDDGYQAHYKYAFPILQKYNIPATFFLNSGFVVNKGQTQIERYGFWEEFKEMSDAGMEMASHSLTHQNLTALEYDALKKELEQDKANIEKNIGKLCTSHAYPYCLHNDIVDYYTSSMFVASRQCGDMFNNIPTTDADWASINSEMLIWDYPRSIANDKKDFETMKQNINRLNGNFGVILMHEVLPFNKLSTSNTYEITTTEYLEDLAAELAAQQEAGNLWVTTFSSIACYSKERQNLRVSKEVISEDSIRYNFTTWLDTAIYRTPLTMEWSVPEGWSEVIVVKMCGDMVVSEEHMTPEDGKIMFDIIPDQESLLLVFPREAVGIQTPNTGIDIKGFPNPVKDILYLKNVPGKVTCKVYNMLGVEVASRKAESNAGIASINVESLITGTYVVRVMSENNETLSSFIIIKL